MTEESATGEECDIPVLRKEEHPGISWERDLWLRYDDSSLCNIEDCPSPTVPPEYTHGPKETSTPQSGQLLHNKSWSLSDVTLSDDEDDRDNHHLCENGAPQINSIASPVSLPLANSWDTLESTRTLSRTASHCTASSSKMYQEGASDQRVCDEVAACSHYNQFSHSPTKYPHFKHSRSSCRVSTVTVESSRSKIRDSTASESNSLLDTTVVNNYSNNFAENTMIFVAPASSQVVCPGKIVKNKDLDVKTRTLQKKKLEVFNNQLSVHTKSQRLPQTSTRISETSVQGQTFQKVESNSQTKINSSNVNPKPSAASSNIQPLNILSGHESRIQDFSDYKHGSKTERKQQFINIESNANSFKVTPNKLSTVINLNKLSTKIVKQSSISGFSDIGNFVQDLPDLIATEKKEQSAVEADQEDMKSSTPESMSGSSSKMSQNDSIIKLHTSKLIHSKHENNNADLEASILNSDSTEEKLQDSLHSSIAESIHSLHAKSQAEITVTEKKSTLSTVGESPVNKMPYKVTRMASENKQPILSNEINNLDKSKCAFSLKLPKKQKTVSNNNKQSTEDMGATHKQGSMNNNNKSKYSKIDKHSKPKNTTKSQSSRLGEAPSNFEPQDVEECFIAKYKPQRTKPVRFLPFSTVQFFPDATPDFL